jgi:hypothetical protein
MVKLPLVAVTGVPGETALLPMLDPPEHALQMSIQKIIVARATHCKMAVRVARFFGATWGERKNITHLYDWILKGRSSGRVLGLAFQFRDKRIPSANGQKRC